MTVNKKSRFGNISLSIFFLFIIFVMLFISSIPGADGSQYKRHFVRVSPRDGRYFELSDGSPFIPNGLNMIAPYGRSEQEALQYMERWIKSLSENGGNYIRLWLSHNFFDIETIERSIPC